MKGKVPKRLPPRPCRLLFFPPESGTVTEEILQVRHCFRDVNMKNIKLLWT